MFIRGAETKMQDKEERKLSTSLKEKELKLKFEELHESQEKIKESEKAYRAIFENTGTAMMIVEEDKTISLINSRFEEISGYTKDEIEGKIKWTIFVDQKDLQRMVSYNDERWRSPDKVPSQYVFDFITRESSVKPVQLSIGIIPGTKKAVVSLLDLTELVKMEDKIKESERKY